MIVYRLFICLFKGILPISMKRSCPSPFSKGYSHTQACSASSNREGCCNAVGGIRMSSKKPNVTASVIVFQLVSVFYAISAIKLTMHSFTTATPYFTGYDVTDCWTEYNIPKNHFSVRRPISRQYDGITKLDNIFQGNTQADV